MSNTKQNAAGLAAATKALQSLGVAFRVAGDAIAKSWYSAMETWYRQHHGKLPGSQRTARLRKKRRTEVMRWVDNQLGD